MTHQVGDVNVGGDLLSPLDGAGTYFPRNASDASEAFDTLRQRLPSELVLEILEQAEYWLLSRITRKDNITYDQDDCYDRNPYLTSPPIQGERFPVRKIRIVIHSHDQGWSDHREDHGTFRNSWTWFDLGIERPAGGGEVDTENQSRIVTNKHARRNTTRHEIVYRSDQDLHWVQRLQAGDRLSIIPQARFPGWVNYVEQACIEVYTAAIF